MDAHHERRPSTPVSAEGLGRPRRPPPRRQAQAGLQVPVERGDPRRTARSVVVGKGTNTADTFYWGFPEKETIFENASNDKKQAGDGAYLFDPDGELRAYTMYPCRVSCSEPLAGKVAVTARYQGLEHEWVTLTNTSSAPISLYQYELENSPWFYEFGPRDVIQPGKSIVVWVNKPHPVPAVNGGRALLTPRPACSRSRASSRAASGAGTTAIALLNDGADAVTAAQPARHARPGRL